MHSPPRHVLPLVLLSLTASSAAAERSDISDTPNVSPAIAINSSADPCDVESTKRAAKAPRSHWQARLDRPTAIYIVRHLQRACRQLTSFVGDYRPLLDKNGATARITDFIGQVRANALEPVYRAYPDLRAKDHMQQNVSHGRIARRTALRLRAALSELQNGFMATVSGLDETVPAESTKAFIGAITDVIAEFGFATDPIYKRFPDLWAAELKAAHGRVPARTAESDAAFWKSVPPAGTVKLSLRALSVARKYAATVRKSRNRDAITSISWVEEMGAKGPNDAEWRMYGPGLQMGSYALRQVPPDDIETIDGLKVILTAPDPSLLVGKTIDFQNGKFVLLSPSP